MFLTHINWYGIITIQHPDIHWILPEDFEGSKSFDAWQHCHFLREASRMNLQTCTLSCSISYRIHLFADEMMWDYILQVSQFSPIPMLRKEIFLTTSFVFACGEGRMQETVSKECLSQSFSKISRHSKNPRIWIAPCFGEPARRGSPHHSLQTLARWSQTVEGQSE